MKKYFKMSSAAVMIGALRFNVLLCWMSPVWRCDHLAVEERAGCFEFCCSVTYLSLILFLHFLLVPLLGHVL